MKLLALIGVMAMLLSSCAIGGKGEDDTTVYLNQRQKDILAEQGLPTDYETLPLMEEMNKCNYPEAS